MVLAALLILSVAPNAAPDSNPHAPAAAYELRRSVVGGGLHASTHSSPDYSLAPTVGEAFANVTGATAEFELESGFWAGSQNPSDTIFKDNFDGGVVPQ